MCCSAVEISPYPKPLGAEWLKFDSTLVAGKSLEVDNRGSVRKLPPHSETKDISTISGGPWNLILEIGDMETPQGPSLSESSQSQVVGPIMYEEFELSLPNRSVCVTVSKI